MAGFGHGLPVSLQTGWFGVRPSRDAAVARTHAYNVSYGTAMMPSEADVGAIMWATALREWRDWLVCAGRPTTTIQLRMYQMRRFASGHPRPWDQTQQSLTAWLAEQDWSTETRRSYRSALRGFYAWAVAAGYAAHDPAALLPAIRALRSAMQHAA